MCYEPSARPPHPPIAGGAASGRRLRLTAADGNQLAAFEAAPETAGRAAVVILPDVRGLHPFYEELALRFAEAGIGAVAIDYFGRTAGPGYRDEDFDFWPHVERTRPATVATDVGAAVEHARESIGATAVFTVGFCFGGRHSFNQAAEGHGLAGVIGFYGRVMRRDDGDDNAPVDRVGSYACPVLGLFGGADQGIPPEDATAFHRALDDAGGTGDVVIYDGAPHSFFDRLAGEFREECEDSWRRILGFVERYS